MLFDIIIFDIIKSNTNSLYIPEFDREDYKYWSIKINTLLMGKDLWNIMVDEYLELVDWNLLLDDAKKIKE